MTDRLQEGYQPNFDIDLALGQRGERFVLDTITSWTAGRVEVKTDERARDTGNLFVEYRCKGRPSGIEVTKADAWAYVVGSAIFVLPTAQLRAVCSSGALRWVNMPRGSHPTTGYLLPIQRIPALFPAS